MPRNLDDNAAANRTVSTGWTIAWLYKGSSMGRYPLHGGLYHRCFRSTVTPQVLQKPSYGTRLSRWQPPVMPWWTFQIAATANARWECLAGHHDRVAHCLLPLSTTWSFQRLPVPRFPAFGGQEKWHGSSLSGFSAIRDSYPSPQPQLDSTIAMMGNYCSH